MHFTQIVKLNFQLVETAIKTKKAIKNELGVHNQSEVKAILFIRSTLYPYRFFLCKSHHMGLCICVLRRYCSLP